MSESIIIVGEILQGAQGRWVGPAAGLNRSVANVGTDSRTIGPGALFFALAGERFDGHDFALQALQKGVVAVVVEEKWYQQHQRETDGQPFYIVDNTLVAFQEAARAYRRRFNIPVVALTGSVGKTTTKEAIFSVLSQRFHVLRNKKSFNNHVGVPATLFELRPEHQVLLTELGTNHFGELERLSYLVEPDIAIITAIGFAHMQFFKNLEGVMQAKGEIFKYCRPDALAIYNADDDLLRSYVFPVNRTFSFAMHERADLTAKILSCDDRAAYTIELLGQQIHLPISGKHNVYNALVAAAVGLQFNLSSAEIKSGLLALKAVEKRMEVFSVGSVTILDDTYNSNPNSCRAALDTLADMRIKNEGRRIAVLADMLELGDYSRPEHRQLADVFQANHLDLLFLYGTETQHTFSRSQDIGIQAAYYMDKENLITELKNAVHANDIVLFKGSRGMQMETLVEKLQYYLREN